MHVLELLLAGLIAGMLDTVVGFGGALLLLPLMVVLVGSVDAVLLSPIVSLGWSIPRMVLTRDWIRWREVGLFSLGIVPATIIGALFLTSIDPEILRQAIGVMLVLFGLFYLARLYLDMPQPKSMHRTVYPMIGFVSGFVGTVLGAGHGPINGGALLAGGMPVREAAATNGALGGATALFRAVSFGVKGYYGEELLLPAVLAASGACVGAFIGVRFSRLSSDATLELVISIAMVLAGLTMLF